MSCHSTLLLAVAVPILATNRTRSRRRAPGLFHDETVRIRHVRRQRALEDPGDVNDVLVVGTAPSVG